MLNAEKAQSRSGGLVFSDTLPRHPMLRPILLALAELHLEQIEGRSIGADAAAKVENVSSSSLCTSPIVLPSKIFYVQ